MSTDIITECSCLLEKYSQHCIVTGQGPCLTQRYREPGTQVKQSPEDRPSTNPGVRAQGKSKELFANKSVSD